MVNGYGSRLVRSQMGGVDCHPIPAAAPATMAKSDINGSGSLCRHTSDYLEVAPAFPTFSFSTCFYWRVPPNMLVVG